MKSILFMKTALACFLALAAAGPGLGASDSRSAAFMWDQAAAAMCNARTPDDFMAAAAACDQLVRAGARNAPLFFNAGTALLEAGMPDDAMKCLLRAERYAGNTPDIRRNMRIAQSEIEKKSPNRGLPWYRPILFWHYNIAGPTRMTLAVAGFSCLWIALGIRLLGVRGAAAKLLIAGAALLVVFGSSAVTTWHAEATAESGILPENAAPPPVRSPQ